MMQLEYTPHGPPCFRDFYLGNESRLEAAWKALDGINRGPDEDLHITDAELGWHWLSDYRDGHVSAATFLNLLECYADAAGNSLYDLVEDNREIANPVLDLLEPRHLEALKQHHWEAVRELADQLVARVSGEMQRELDQMLSEFRKKGARIVYAELRDHVRIVYDFEKRLRSVTFGLDRTDDGKHTWTVDNPAPWPLARFCRKYNGRERTEIDLDDVLDMVSYPDFFWHDLIPTLWPLAIRDVCRDASPRKLLLFLAGDGERVAEWEVTQVLQSSAGRRLGTLTRHQWVELLADSHAGVRTMAMRCHARLVSQEPQEQKGRAR